MTWIAGLFFAEDAEIGYGLCVALKMASRCEIRTSFATAFRNWRLSKKLPLKKIARDLGLSIATIGKWEAGERFPTGYNLELLADYTGVPVCQLFCRMAGDCLQAGCPLCGAKGE